MNSYIKIIRKKIW